MLFNSYIFLLLFLPLTIIVYFMFNHYKKYSIAETFLLAMSLWFYGFFNSSYLSIILLSIIVNFGTYKLLNHFYDNHVRKTILGIGLLFNIGILFYFKYFDFFISNINVIFSSNFILKNLVLPLGISFFTFQQLSFVIDAYKKEVPFYNFRNYALFVTFFPQLIAGPIVTHDELVPQFMDVSKKKFDWYNMAAGTYIFAIGLSKKVLIADTFGNVVNYGFTNYIQLNTVNAILTILAYTIQIYFDFSGYCDMAIGIAKMLNFDLPLNFDSPYKALTISGFWKRWHITLTRFFTRYVYIPLGGNRKGNRRMYLNVFIVFLASGLWHGANWTFVLWGMMHGMFLMITRWKKGFFHRLHPALNWLITFLFINITWVFFRANSITSALVILKRVLMFDFGPIDLNIINCFKLPEISFFYELPLMTKITSFLPNFFSLGIFYVAAIVILLGCKNSYERMKSLTLSFGNSLITVILLVWCILSFSGVSTFLYFNF